MFFSNEMASCLLAFALYGIYTLLQEAYRWSSSRSARSARLTSILVIFHNQEEVVERVVRSLLRSLANSGQDFEVVAVDRASTDLTSLILDRLAERLPGLQVLHASHEEVGKGITLCRGSVIHVLDVARRLSPEEAMDWAAYRR